MKHYIVVGSSTPDGTDNYESLLAQSSDWPFILRTGTSPAYAKKRVKDHLLRFIALHEQLTTTKVDEVWLTQIESMDNIFPEVNPAYWA